MRSVWSLAAALQLLLVVSGVQADDVPCSVDNPCTEGCCSSVSEVCGYGPGYCGSTCIQAASLNSTCTHLSECNPGSYPGWGETWASNYSTSESCPLNVCCSEFGFCGTSTDFCGTSTWDSPSCSSNTTATRRIGYYEAFNLDHACNTMTVEEIPVGGYTHLIFSFLYIDPDTYEMAPMESNQTDLYARFTALKDYGVETWISIGGWAMTDPGEYSHVFSKLAASTTAQTKFLSSLKAFLANYGFDGVDIDWEYPGAPDRYGSDADYENFVSFLKNVRSSLGSDYGLSITLPSSYWYLQYFDIVNLEKHFNFMAYDIYGTWDATISSIGSRVYASTNLTMIEAGLKLLWHNNIEPSKVNLGLGLYGRSYTLEDSSCTEPGCAFTTGGNPGPCSQTEGLLSYDEIMDIIDDSSRNPTVWLDSEAAVKIAVYDGDQWVAYDDPETLQMKLDFTNSECMGGYCFSPEVFQGNIAKSQAESISNSPDLFPAGGSGKVYISPHIWDEDSPEVSCVAPCTLILPPLHMEASRTVTWPALTTPVLVSKDGSIVTSTTTISIPAFGVGSIPFWPVTIASNKTSGALVPVQSITPPSLVIVFPGSVAPLPIATTNYTSVAEDQVASMNQGNSSNPSASGTVIGPATNTASATSTAVVTPSLIAANMESGCTKFYQIQSGDSCWSVENDNNIDASDFEAWNPDVGTDCASGVWLDYYYCISHSGSASSSSGGSGGSSSTSSTVVPVFYSTSHSVTIQPQATHATITPSKTIPSINFESGKPKDSGSSDGDCDGCGTLDCAIFGCDGKCGIFGCDGGCGLTWCGGGCGLSTCGPGCGTTGCVVEGGGGGGGSTGSIGLESGEDGDCEDIKTVDVCTVFIKSFSTSGMESSSTTTTTACAYSEGCSATPTTTTTTVSTTGTYSTEKVSFMYTSTSVPASVMSSISSRISSQRSVWDATRWSGYTITATSASSSANALPTGFQIVQDVRGAADVQFVWWAVYYTGLDLPIVLDDRMQPGLDEWNAKNTETTFCDQTSWFSMDDSGNLIGDSDGVKYTCTPIPGVSATAIPPTSTYTEVGDNDTVYPVYDCLTHICT